MNVTKRPVPQPEPPQIYTIELSEEDVIILRTALSMARSWSTRHYANNRAELFCIDLNTQLNKIGAPL